VAHEKISSKKVSADSKDRPQAALLAIDLQYSRVQEAEIGEDLFCYHDEYTLTKYGENQMIKFGGSYHNNITGTMVRIMIKSFQRISSSEILHKKFKLFWLSMKKWKARTWFQRYVYTQRRFTKIYCLFLEGEVTSISPDLKIQLGAST